MKDLLVQIACWEEDELDLAKLRYEVFVEEQNVPFDLEVDGLDPDCKHVKATADGITVGTGRLLKNGSIGRMCVHRDYRQYGIGRLLLKNLIEQAESEGYPEISLNSQSYAIPFYQKNGFIVVSNEFMDAGIAHRRMVYEIN